MTKTDFQTTNQFLTFKCCSKQIRIKQALNSFDLFKFKWKLKNKDIQLGSLLI